MEKIVVLQDTYSSIPSNIFFSICYVQNALIRTIISNKRGLQTKSER